MVILSFKKKKKGIHRKSINYVKMKKEISGINVYNLPTVKIFNIVRSQNLLGEKNYTSNKIQIILS